MWILLIIIKHRKETRSNRSLRTWKRASSLRDVSGAPRRCFGGYRACIPPRLDTSVGTRRTRRTRRCALVWLGTRKRCKSPTTRPWFPSPICWPCISPTTTRRKACDKATTPGRNTGLACIAKIKNNTTWLYPQKKRTKKRSGRPEVKLRAKSRKISTCRTTSPKTTINNT